MSFGIFLCTEIISIVHAIQSDELANFQDISLDHSFHTVHLLYLVYSILSAAVWRVLLGSYFPIILACQPISAPDPTSNPGDAAAQDRCDVYYWLILNKV